MRNVTIKILILALINCSLVQNSGQSYLSRATSNKQLVASAVLSLSKDAVESKSGDALRPIAERCILGKAVIAKSEEETSPKDPFVLHINEDRDAQHVAVREESLDFSKWKEVALNIIHFFRFIIGKNFKYTDFVKSLTAYPSKHMLFITDLREDEVGIGDTLVFYKPIIQILLKLFPDAKITVVTNKVDLFEQHNPRFHILPQNEFLDIYDKNIYKLVANLETFRDKLEIDSVIDMSWGYHKNWQASMFKVFPGIVVLMHSKYGVMKKIPDQATSFNTLPYRLSLAFFKNFQSQTDALVKNFDAYKPGPSRSMILNINAKDRAWLDSIIENNERPLVLLNLFTTEKRRDWSSVKEIAFFIENAIKEENISLIIPRPLNREQRLLINRVMKKIPTPLHPFITIIEKEGLREVKLLIKKANYIITTDTGIGHLAVALKKEPIVLFNNSLFKLNKGLCLSWLPSQRVKDKKDYVVSFFPGHFNPKKVIKKLIQQKKRFAELDTKVSLRPDNKIPPATTPDVSKLEIELSEGTNNIGTEKTAVHSALAGAIPLNYPLHISSAA